MVYPDEVMPLSEEERKLASSLEVAIDTELKVHNFSLASAFSYRLTSSFPLKVCWVLVSRYRGAGWHAQIIWNSNGAWIVIAP